MNYLEELSLSLAAVNDAFKHNEVKYGEGLRFSTVVDETGKLSNHLRTHCVGYRGLSTAGVDNSENLLNKEDNCLHLTSVACRALKALELFLRENPKYRKMFTEANSSVAALPAEKG